jgi:hypothetical protein
LAFPFSVWLFFVSLFLLSLPGRGAGSAGDCSHSAGNCAHAAHRLAKPQRSRTKLVLRGRKSPEELTTQVLESYGLPPRWRNENSARPRNRLLKRDDQTAASGEQLAAIPRREKLNEMQQLFEVF